jgi:hypothetical protein
MTVVLAQHHQPVTLWTAQDNNDKWHIGRLITENGKRYIVERGIKHEVKKNTTPRAYEN